MFFMVKYNNEYGTRLVLTGMPLLMIKICMYLTKKAKIGVGTHPLAMVLLYC